MSVTVGQESPVAPLTSERLLHGLREDGVRTGLESHLARWGALRLDRPARTFDELEASGLVGHGGAWFPVAAKWRAVAAGSRRRPVVVANGAESEPASRKDAFLLARAPHLVLDGLAVAAHTLRASRAIAYVPSPSVEAMTAALAERHRRGLDPVNVEVREAADTFLAGQESAVVSALSGRRAALPTFTGLQSVRERGVGGRPTLVQNVETLAHVGLVARFGSGWFRTVGTEDSPGTMLLTVTRPSGQVIMEAVLGSTLREAAGITTDELAHCRGVLLGGYGGGWVSTNTFNELRVNEKAARRAGSTLGAGVVALLPLDVCPLAEMADVVRYMEGQGAGQCGPCVHGLAALADAMESLAHGPARGGARIDAILDTCTLVEGRGACRHPDGVTRFIRSGLSVFAGDVTSHQRHGSCPAARAPRTLPVPHRTVSRRLVSRA